MPRDQINRILLGRIVGAHGIRGDVAVQAHTSDPAGLSSYGPLTDRSGARRFEVERLRVTAKGAVVHFKGISDRTAAEALRGVDLYVDRSALPQAEDGTYYHVDLVGLRVDDPAGTEVGQVIAVQDFGGGTLLEVRKRGADETEFVPFTDTFVPTVDVAAGRVVITMPVLVGEPEEKISKDDGDA